MEGFPANGSASERIRYVVWMEFYDNRIPRADLRDIKVICLTRTKNTWYGIAHAETADDNTIYRVSFTDQNTHLQVEVYQRIQIVNLTI